MKTLNGRIYLEVGETTEIEGIKVECVEKENENIIHCKRCALIIFLNCCSHVVCGMLFRRDGKAVLFKKIEP
jgi:hypothetical protein